MLNQPLVLSNAIYAADYVKAITTEKDGIRLHFADGGERLYPLQDFGKHKGADGRRILAIFEDLQRADATAHYRKVLADYNRMIAEGQIAPQEQFEPVEPVHNPETIF